MVTAKLDEYSKADKSEKSFIITEVMEKVHERSPNGGGFLKLDPASGRWYMVGEYLSREKVRAIVLSRPSWRIKIQSTHNS